LRGAPLPILNQHGGQGSDEAISLFTSASIFPDKQEKWAAELNSYQS
jgi:hypothetical protein